MAVGAFPAHVAFKEGMRLNRLISAVLNHEDLFLRVRDSHEGAPTTDWTRERTEIQSATAASNPTFYDVGRNGKPIGQFTLAFGKKSNVVSEWSWSDDVEGAEALMIQLAEL